MTDATETLTIDAFIEARLREDEETARAAMTWDDTTRWVADHQGVFEVADGIGRDDELIASTGVQHVSDGLEYERATHIALHDPERVLRQCAALRAIMRVNVDVADSDSGASIQIAEAIASIWSSHPDFRAEWTA